MKIEKVKVYSIGKEIDNNGFKKKEIIITDGEETHFPQHLPIEVTEKKFSEFSPLSVGDIIDIDVNFRGRLYTDKTGQEKAFLSIQAWKYTLISKGSPIVTVEKLPF